MSKYFLILLITTSFTAHAAIYEKTQNGVKVFSDSPETGGTEISLPKESSFKEWHPNKRPEPPEPPEPIDVAQEPQKEPAADDATKRAPYQKVILDNIHEQETFHNERRIPVNIAVLPKLQPGDKIRLLVDGRIYREQESNDFVLDNLPRGKHTLQAIVIGADGSTMSTGKTNIYVQYHSQLFSGQKGAVPLAKPR